VRRALPVAALAVVTVALVLLGAKINGHFDLKVYYGATRSWLHGGDLYGYAEPGRDRDYGFTYPPFGALALAPLAVLPFAVAAEVLDCATVAATLALLVVLLRPLVRDRGWNLAATVTVGLLLAFALDPWRMTFNYGQINLLLVLLVTVDVVVLLDRRAGGVLIGVATAVKLVPGLFIVYLLVTRRRRAALVATGTAAAATLLMWVIAPRTSTAYWTEQLWQGDRVGDPGFVSNQSLNGLVSRAGGGPAAPIVFAGLALAVLGWWGGCVGRDRDPRLGLALTGAAAGLISPITWVHHLVFLIPALTLLLDGAVRTGRKALWAVLGLVYATLASRVVWRFNAFTAHGLAQVPADAYVLATLLLLIATPVMLDWRQTLDGSPRTGSP
jgi:alpha-1,2-mannosyltransferase